MISLILGLMVLPGGTLGAQGLPGDMDESSNPADVTGKHPDNLEWAQVRFVEVTEADDGSWRFAVTVEHADQGWDHYADAWQVVSPDGSTVIAERILLHPHDGEQPFTRSQAGIEVPRGMTTVLVRARCNVHGFGGAAVLVDLSAESGKHFSVHRK